MQTMLNKSSFGGAKVVAKRATKGPFARNIIVQAIAAPPKLNTKRSEEVSSRYAGRIRLRHVPRLRSATSRPHGACVIIPRYNVLDKECVAAADLHLHLAFCQTSLHPQELHHERLSLFCKCSAP